LYTVDGWRTFLRALTETGVLTMTRFYLPETPAETERLVSLAAQVMAEEGFTDPAAHGILAADGTTREIAERHHVHVTILRSKTPFTPAEVERIGGLCGSEGYTLLAAPGVRSPDPVLERLLDPSSRPRAIAESPYDISAPTDLRPYFFLQVRPRDVLS